VLDSPPGRSRPRRACREPEVNGSDGSAASRQEVGAAAAAASPGDVEVHERGSQRTSRQLSRHIAVLFLGVTLVTVTVSAAAQADDCQNAPVRAQQMSGELPDCRAYELVSPLDKKGGDVVGYLTNVRSSASGDRTTFGSFAGFADAPGVRYVVEYLGSRDGRGWSAASLTPQQNFGSFNATGPPAPVGYSPDLSQVAVQAGDPAPAPGAQPGTFNLFTRNSFSGTFDLLTPVGVSRPVNVGFADSSDDFSHVLFESKARLTPDAPIDNPAGNDPADLVNLYERVGEQVRLVGILPDGTPAASGAQAGFVLPLGTFSRSRGALGGVYTHSAMSRDGSRIFWTDLGTNQIYVRLDGTHTLHVSRTQRRIPDVTRPAIFQGATPSGSIAFFLSNEKLTDDSTAGDNPFSGADSQGDLYAFDVDSGRLTDLMAVPGASAAGLALLGSSDDGSKVYFAAYGNPLARGAPTDQTAVYLWHDGAISHVATLPGVAYTGEGTDASNWSVHPLDGNRPNTARVSDDGRYLLFSSVEPLTGYANDGHVELYRYDAEAGALTCISCGPAGSSATADATLGTAAPNGQGNLQGAAPFLTNNLSADGETVFFQTADALVDGDSNGRVDVYEWRAGEAHLISSGKDSSDSYVGDASRDGSSVFFTTRQQLVAADQDANTDLYSARVDGGYLAPVTPNPCRDDECQGPVTSSPIPLVPGSPTFFGEGNVVDAPPGRRTVKLTVSRVTKRQRSKFAKTGTLVLRVTADAAATVTATARAKIGGKARFVGKITTKLRRAGTAGLTLRLSRPARRELRKRHKLMVTVTVSMPGARSRAAHMTLTTRGR
jgi:hypothetical protein